MRQSKHGSVGKRRVKKMAKTARGDIVARGARTFVRKQLDNYVRRTHATLSVSRCSPHARHARLRDAPRVPPATCYLRHLPPLPTPLPYAHCASLPALLPRLPATTRHLPAYCRLYTRCIPPCHCLHYTPATYTPRTAAHNSTRSTTCAPSYRPHTLAILRCL